MRVRVVMSRPFNGDAVTITVFGYEDEGEGEIKSYQGYPFWHQFDPIPGSKPKDGWLWVPINPGDQVEPSIVFPGTWDADGNGIEQAIRHFSGVDSMKISAAYSMGKRHEEHMEKLDKQNAELRNRIENLENQVAELRSNQGL